MSSQQFALVCPLEQTLLDKLAGHRLVIRTENVDELAEVASINHHVDAVIFRSTLALPSIFPLPHWGSALLSLYAAEFGSFRELVPHLNFLRTANIRVFLPAERPENLSGLRILSSLGIPCGLDFGGQYQDWEAISDLMHYFIYSKVPHAIIEPFYHVTRNYSPNAQLNIGAVYFDDPARYLHVSKDGRIAASHNHLITDKYFADSLIELDAITHNTGYLASLNEWRHFFLQNDGCAYCASWRVCMGRFSGRTDGDACVRFFSELMDAVEDLHARQKGASA